MTLATEINETLENRSVELEGWERKRRNEVSLDLFRSLLSVSASPHSNRYTFSRPLLL
jgi:hypothetical protein